MTDRPTKRPAAQTEQEGRRESQTDKHRQRDRQIQTIRGRQRKVTNNHQTDRVRQTDGQSQRAIQRQKRVCSCTINQFKTQVTKSHVRPIRCHNVKNQPFCSLSMHRYTCFCTRVCSCTINQFETQVTKSHVRPIHCHNVKNLTILLSVSAQIYRFLYPFIFR